MVSVSQTSGLAPEITIHDSNGNEKYRFEHPDIAEGGSPIHEMRITSWHIRAGLNNDAGSASITIQDHENTLTDRSDPRRPIAIKNGWILQIRLKKQHHDMATWFYGIIENPAITRPGHAEQYITITAMGYGIRLPHTFGSISHYQRRGNDGISLDNTDNDARISDIIRRIITDPENLVSPSAAPLGITANGIDDIDIRVPDFVRNFQSLGMMVNELAGMGDCIYAVNPDRDMSLHIRGSRPSGHLITNDNDGSLIRSWNQHKASIMANRPYMIPESSIGSGYSTIIGLGAVHEEVASSRTTSGAGSPLTLPADTDTSFSFRLGHASLGRISIRLSRTGNCTGSLRVSLVGSDTGSAIDPDDIRAVDVITAARLNHELAADGTPSYIEVGFGRDPVRLFPQADMHVIISGNDDPVRLHRSGSGSVRRRTGNNESWDAISGGGANYRAYSAETVHIVAQDTARRSIQGHKETIIPLYDFPSEGATIIALGGMLDIMGSIRRAYSRITISAPDDRPDCGETMRMYDTHTGTDTTVELIGYEIGASQDPPDNLIASTMEISVEEWIS